jgi:C-terminal processing protease CtpA/Prc
VRGESDSLREFLIGHKFALLYWAIYGGFDEYRVVLRNPDGTVSSQVLPAAADDGIAQDPPPDPFQFQRLDQNTALLRIPSFDIALRDRFLAFLEQSFAQVAADKVTRLLIDIRENGGGARDLSDPLLSYLTDARYTPTSKVKARITAENAARVPGSQPGQVIDLPFPQWVEPTARPWRFAGELYVLFGARTYSQAIVFATIVQDFGIGKLVGEETAGLANQTGQVTKTTLPNTGLSVQAPIYIFYRAKPRIGESGVAPDITLPSDLHHPESMIDELLTRLDQGGPKSGADAQTTEHGR